MPVKSCTHTNYSCLISGIASCRIYVHDRLRDMANHISHELGRPAEWLLTDMAADDDLPQVCSGLGSKRFLGTKDCTCSFDIF
jgi:hypothetical protein